MTVVDTDAGNDAPLYTIIVTMTTLLVATVILIAVVRYRRAKSSKSVNLYVKTKFHYASWFEAGSELVRAEIWPII